MKKSVGGAIESPYPETFSYFTDSGRSSLRLILRSMSSETRYMLPDFLCSSIVKVFQELGLKYNFYKVKTDLSIDPESIANLDFDVFYFIKYFGNPVKNLNKLVDASKTVIEDSVFLPEPGICNIFNRYISFNSFRKISGLADGSLVRSSFPLKSELIKTVPAPFAELKRKAAGVKYEYIKYGKASEEKYLELFEAGEKLLDEQKEIFSMMSESHFALLDFSKELLGEQRKRLANFALLENELRDFAIKIKPEFPSFFPLTIENRNEVRKRLFKKRIFLPVHWPNEEKLMNPLYDRIISVPLDSRYSPADMKRVAAELKKVL